MRKEGKFTCDVCGKAAKKEDLDAQVYAVDGRLYAFDVCNRCHGRAMFEGFRKRIGEDR